MVAPEATELGTRPGTESGTGSSPRGRELASLGEGTVVGRYVLKERLGAGAMGVVFAAVDPELDRRVALKLLYRYPDDGPDEPGHRRLLREAQALAQVSHPHVVTIHDVGEHEGGVFLAMELVRGQTLRRWLGSFRREEEILSVFVAAARGLQAAHQQGVVHRDFKPDNVMVGDDGRVRVMDFGLARSTQGAILEPSVPETHDIPSGAVSLTTALTQAGRLLGTPAYMAPEQFASESPGPAADQFSWCVSLWEALSDRRPFSGGSNAELANNVLRGLSADVPGESEIPSWLRPILRRGLQRVPEDRWPSLSVLIAEIERGRSRRPAKALGVAAGLVSLLVAAAVVDSNQAEPVAHCPRKDDALTDIWNPASREQVRAAIVRLDAGEGPRVADIVLTRLDAFTRRWIDAKTELCRVRAPGADSMSALVADRARWCLQSSREKLALAVQRLPSHEITSVKVPILVVDALPSPAQCLDETVLARRPAPQRSQWDVASRVRSDLGRVEVLRRAGELDEAHALGQRTLEQAEAAGWMPLVAEVHLELGRNAKHATERDGAREDMRIAYFTAASSGATDVAMEAAISLELDLGYRSGRIEAAETWIRNVDALLEGQPQPNDMLLSRHLMAQALILKAQDRYEEALELQLRAAEIRGRQVGESHASMAQIHNNTANMLRELGRNEEAVALHERALRIRIDLFGRKNLDVTESLNNLGNARKHAGDLHGAREALEEALATNTEMLGEEHGLVGMNLYNLADLDRRDGRLAEAAERLQRAHEIYAKAEGNDSWRAGAALAKLGEVTHARGDVAQAVETLERANLILESVEERPADTGEARAALARALWDSGSDPQRSLRLARQAQADFQRSERSVDEELADLEAWLAERDSPSP